MACGVARLRDLEFGHSHMDHSPSEPQLPDVEIDTPALGIGCGNSNWSNGMLLVFAMDESQNG